MTAIKKFLVFLIFLLLANSTAMSAEKLKIAVTHPWLAILASFIGGAEVEIIQILTWNPDGDLIRTSNGKILKELPDRTKIIAIDEAEAKSAGINLNKNEKNFDIRLLYKPFPIGINRIADPSVVPFVAQRVLTALSEWDAANYPFYQRRLAEFQARLSSSMLAGQVLNGALIYDLSVSSGILLQAAGCKISRPSSEMLTQLQNYGAGALKNFANEKHSQGYIIFMDAWTHKNIKRHLEGRSDVYLWALPSIEMDYPSFLHEQYISLWQKITAKPLPGIRR